MILNLYNYQTMKTSEHVPNNEVQGIILDTRKINLDDYKNLKIISRIGIGLDNIDLMEYNERGIKVYTTPCEELTDAVAEHTIYLILGILRKRKENLVNKKVGVIGCGRIGSKVKRILGNGFGLSVNSSDLYDNENYKDNLLKASDIITIHVSGNDEVVGSEEVKLMKKGSYIINTAREKCVNVRAVCNGLTSGKLNGFASDVNNNFFEKSEFYYASLFPVADMVLLTDHIASQTKQAREVMEQMAIDNLKKGLK